MHWGSRREDDQSREIAPNRDLWKKLWSFIPGAEEMYQFTALAFLDDGWFGVNWKLRFSLDDKGNPTAHVVSFQGPDPTQTVGRILESKDVFFDSKESLEQFFKNRTVSLYFGKWNISSAIER